MAGAWYARRGWGGRGSRSAVWVRGKRDLLRPPNVSLFGKTGALPPPSPAVRVKARLQKAGLHSWSGRHPRRLSLFLHTRSARIGEDVMSAAHLMAGSWRTKPVLAAPDGGAAFRAEAVTRAQGVTTLRTEACRVLSPPSSVVASPACPLQSPGRCGRNPTTPAPQDDD